MKLCWLLTIFQSDAISAHGHTSLVSDKHVPALRFQSVSPGAGTLVWFSCSQWWKWMVHRTITVMSCCSNSCCNTSVKQLVTFNAPRVHKSTEQLWHKTPDFTPDMWHLNRPDHLNPVDYGTWTVIHECIYQKQQVTLALALAWVFFTFPQTPTVRPKAHYVVIISCVIRSSMHGWKETFSVLGERQMSIVFFSVQSAAGSTLSVQQWKMLDPLFSGSSMGRHSLRD